MCEMGFLLEVPSMNRIVCATGFLLFTGVSFLHFSGLWRIVAQLWPALGMVAAAG